ncbi:MAG TPA: Hint domain-containing protein, partial [Alphaproteobacteria bacterium]|nr:Hint domain-containing protein [Alphaproteobacteria bacterium]
VTNETGGTITGAQYGVRVFESGTVVNYGTIKGTAQDGVALNDGGTLTNGAGARIQGKFFGVDAGGAATIDNAGTITATTNNQGQGVKLAAGGQLTNESGGLIQGKYAGVSAYQGATVINHGSIASTNAGDNHAVGVNLGGGGTLINDGSIGGYSGVYILGSDGDTVTNAAGGVIAGSAYGITTSFSSGPATIDNSGTIIGASNDGVFLFDGGTVTNAAHGTITGGSAGISGFGSGPLSIGNAGTIQSTADSDYGVNISAADNTLNNTGLILGGNGADLAGNSATVDNSGTIVGTWASHYAVGINMNAASNLLVNENHGTIIDAYGVGVVFGGTYATLENAGTIEGAAGIDAVQMFGATTNRLIIDPGAVFSGEVFASTYFSTTANTIELKEGGQVGTLSGLGSEYVGFQTVAIDGGAAWDVAGTAIYFDGVTIQGFNSHDQLDLMGLTYGPGGTAILNDSDQLVITEGSSSVTIQMDSGVSGDLFKLVDDGHGGTYVEEDDFTPCYLKGTLIRTADGDVPVERLRIGHWVVTTTGEALPIKWIGRRSYRDWLAVGNDDVQPILFTAGSIADGIPARDLCVSPEHAMLLDGVLVPARHLANGVSIRKVAGMDEIDYFHLEFDRHVVIFAEDAPAESFVDDDSRMLFHNADEYRRLYPDEPRRQVEFCAPRVEAGPALAALHRALAARAQHLRAGGAAAPWGRRGKVEIATSRLIAGWAFSGADAGPVTLAVLVNGAVVGRAVADRYRADLKAAGIGDGRHGFRFVLPKGLVGGIGHKVEIRREIDWSLLDDGSAAAAQAAA